jgi:myo-inositol-1-phosphate synthase
MTNHIKTSIYNQIVEQHFKYFPKKECFLEIHMKDFKVSKNFNKIKPTISVQQLENIKCKPLIKKDSTRINSYNCKT